MDKKRQDIDSFFRENLSDYTLSEKKGNWELLNHLLKAQERKKKYWRLLQFFSSFLLLFFTGFLLLPSSEEKRENTNNTAKNSGAVTSSPLAPNAFIKEEKNNNRHAAEKESNHSAIANNAGDAEPPISTQINTSVPDMNQTVLRETEIFKPSTTPGSPLPSGGAGGGLPVKPHFVDIVFYTGINRNARENISAETAITNIGKEINSAYADFAPVISADGSTLLFTSRRPVTEKEIKNGKQGMENIYVSCYDEKQKKWSEAKRLSEQINQPDRNNSAIALSNDGQRMLLYRDEENRNGDIWESILQGEAWNEPIKLPDPVNSDYHESSAAFSPDGKTIYFVSNRPGGKGGRDIWYCTEDANGKWGKAINIGEPINTQEDEEGVCIHPDGKALYFSSKGHNGKGGYDIFKAPLPPEGGNIGGASSQIPPSGGGGAVVNLGAPINTGGDELFFVISADGETAYYGAAKAEGMGEKDIYKITFTPVQNKNQQTEHKTLALNYFITDELGKPLEGTVEIIDNEKNETLIKLNSAPKESIRTSASGKTLASIASDKNYEINISAKGYLSYSEKLIVPSDTASYTEVTKNIQLKKLEDK